MSVIGGSEAANAALLARLEAIVGARHVLTEPAATAPYFAEPRGHYRGRAAAVVRPGSPAEVAAILRFANATGTPVVPQGGNTGLVGGQTPDESGREIVLSLERLAAIRSLDAAGGTVTAEAGVVLERLQAAAAAAGMLFPLSLGAQGSCQIGGNIATNAGGTGVLAYGSMRNLVLGLEVVLPTGEVWNGLRGLVKDNAGYDLKHLFIGSEGTLGIVTAATLRLYPLPRGQAVAIAGIANPDAALRLFRLVRERAGGGLTAFELMSRTLVAMAVRHLPGAREPLAAPHPWYTLVEISSARDDADAGALMEAALTAALHEGLVADVAVAGSLEQARQFWRMRHSASEVQRREGASAKHDVSVPVERVPEFIEAASAAVAAAMPDARPVPFGHLGDGNIHFNISQPPGMDPAEFITHAGELHARIYAIVGALGGSVAAEHGIGRTKRALLASVRSELEMDLMRRVKRALDPNNILNPGRVL